MLLLLDCHDSFSYNLASLVRSATGQEVIVCTHDALTPKELATALRSVDGVIAGPGPGHPAIPADAGVIPALWTLPEIVPVLGVCFGYQSMVLAHGGTVERLVEPQHGQLGLIWHNDDPLWSEVPSPFEAVRYHSLHVHSTGASRIQRLAWTDDAEMAACIVDRPWYGVQYHPESILSHYGEQMVRNWWLLAQQWNTSRLPRTTLVLPDHVQQTLKPSPRLPDLPKSYIPVSPHIEEVGKVDALLVADVLYQQGQEFVMLHSAAPPGNWSIIGLLEPGKTWHVRIRDGQVIEGVLGSEKAQVHEGDVWKVLADYMGPRIIPPQCGLPFVGGFIGYSSYESACRLSAGSASFVFVTKCIVTGPSGTFLVGGAELPALDGVSLAPINDSKAQVTRPGRNEYTKRISRCDEFLRSGDSYELCLTGESVIEYSPDPHPWQLFRQIVATNPAPYCTYMSFDDTLVGSSPERFVKWNAGGQCQFRPIKGTVAKAPGVTAESASEILHTAKEHGENLMIVDLIRHDLGHLLGTHVKCPQLMSVEEYRSVYQLVSVIEGELSGSAYSGIDVLAESLPPGSMTGAPKARSVELLQQIEQRNRGLYSGVAGYWSITDSGDWSVIIRSLFRYRGDSKWRAGAGGAITVLSTADGEYDEMISKLASVVPQNATVIEH